MTKKKWLLATAWGSVVLLVLKSLLWLCADWNQLLVGLQWTPVVLMLGDGFDWIGSVMTVVTAVLRLVGMAGLCTGFWLMTKKQTQRGSRVAGLSLLLAMIPDALALAPSLALGMRLLGGGSYELLGIFWMVGVAGLALMRVIWLASVSRGFWLGCRFSLLSKMMTAFTLLANVALCVGFAAEYPLGACVWVLEGAVMVFVWLYARKK